MESPLFGTFYVSRSTNLADAQCCNLYPEAVEVKGAGKRIGALYGTPGLTLFATVGTGAIRGLHVTDQYGLIAASGNALYTVAINGGVTLLPGSDPTVTIPGTGPVSMVDNGPTGQVLITANQSAFCYAGTSVAPVTLPFTPTLTGDLSINYQEGFGFLTQPGTNTFWQSQLLDLTNWPALNFAEASVDPDNIIALFDFRDELLVIKEKNIEFWINAGVQNFSYNRLSGTYAEAGCIAQYSVARSGGMVLLLSRNSQGSGVLVGLNGYEPHRLSTTAVERIWQSYSSMSDAFAYVYQQQGRSFYVITFPAGNATWVLDLTMTELLKMPVWHQRGAFSGGQIVRHQGNCFAYYNGMSLVGDYQSGNIYQLDLDNLTDNGAQRKWLRTWRAIEKPTDDPIRFSTLRIDLQTGVGVPPGTTPLCMLRWSDDGGNTWSNYRVGQVPVQGQTAQRLFFTRLGSTRRNHGLDRIFELSSTDQFPVALLGAELV